MKMNEEWHQFQAHTVQDRAVALTLRNPLYLADALQYGVQSSGGPYSLFLGTHVFSNAILSATPGLQKPVSLALKITSPHLAI